MTENPGEFRIDPQNAVISVEHSDGFRHCRKQSVWQGFLSDGCADDLVKPQTLTRLLPASGPLPSLPHEPPLDNLNGF